MDLYRILIVLFTTIDTELFTKCEKLNIRYTPSKSTFMPNKIFAKIVHCYTRDPTFGTVSSCDLIPYNHTMKIITIRAMVKGRAKTVLANLTLYKLEQKNYSPFLLKLSIDVCKYFEGRKNHLFDWMFNMVLPYSNIIHTCPYYNEELYVEKFPINSMRVPSVASFGEYRLDINFTVNGLPLGSVEGFFDIIKG